MNGDFYSMTFSVIVIIANHKKPRDRNIVIVPMLRILDIF